MKKLLFIIFAVSICFGQTRTNVDTIYVDIIKNPSGTVPIEGNLNISAGYASADSFQLNGTTFLTSTALSLGSKTVSTTGAGSFGAISGTTGTFSGDIAVNGDDITSDGDLTITPAGNDLFLNGTFTSQGTLAGLQFQNRTNLGGKWLWFSTTTGGIQTARLYDGAQTWVTVDSGSGKVTLAGTLDLDGNTITSAGNLAITPTGTLITGNAVLRSSGAVAGLEFQNRTTLGGHWLWYSSDADAKLYNGVITRVLVDSATGNMTLGTTDGTGTGAFYAGAISGTNFTATGYLDGGSAITDTSSFTTTGTRKAIYLSGATTADKYSISWRVVTGDESSVPTGIPYYMAKTDSLIVFRTDGTLSGQKFSYQRIK